MRTTLKVGVTSVLAMLGVGCGAMNSSPGVSESALSAAAVSDTLPPCKSIARPLGTLFVEEIAGASQLIVRTGTATTNAPICTGTLNDLSSPGFFRDGPSFGDADNDPMPADGRQPADNDPMPADGNRANNDPMPADGQQAGKNDPMPAHDRRPRGDTTATAATDTSPLSP